jgi:site-specific DNA-methyltransferase (cytosine-N4-specific)
MATVQQALAGRAWGWTVNAVIVRADARSLPLADESVDLIVTSPPYLGQRSYTDGGEHYAGQIGSEATPAEYIAALLDCTREWVRVLRPSGSLFVNLGDKYASPGGRGVQGDTGQMAGRSVVEARRRSIAQQGAGVREWGLPHKSLAGLPWRYTLGCIDQLGLVLRAEIVWSKPNGLPEKVTDRVTRTHEQLFHFTRRPRYYSAGDSIRVPHAGWTAKAYEYEQRGYQRRVNSDRQDQGNFRQPPKLNPAGKIPGSVWDFASEPLQLPDWLDVDHFAPMPMEMARRCILGWSPPAGVVLDPFGGAGTTALVAESFGRRAISADLSHDYGRAARWRVSDPGERARALGVPKPPPVLEGQESLFEDVAL